jgi:hypothetical protein
MEHKIVSGTHITGVKSEKPQLFFEGAYKYVLNQSRNPFVQDIKHMALRVFHGN